MSRLPLEQSDRNRVTIFVWRLCNGGWHTAIKTYFGGRTGTGYYMSLIATDTDTNTNPTSKKSNSIFAPVRGEARSFAEDSRILGRRSDNEIDLYSLDTEEINLEFERFLNSGKLVSLFGSVEIEIIRGETRNCCGLSAALLNAGGINHLVRYDHEKLFEAIGAIAGTGSALFAGSAATSGVMSTSLSGIELLLIGGPIVLAFAGAAFLVGAVAGGFIGGTTGVASEVIQGRKFIVRPDGLENLAIAAQNVEREKYEYYQAPQFNF